MAKHGVSCLHDDFSGGAANQLHLYDSCSHGHTMGGCVRGGRSVVLLLFEVGAFQYRPICRISRGGRSFLSLSSPVGRNKVPETGLVARNSGPAQSSTRSRKYRSEVVSVAEWRSLVYLGTLITFRTLVRIQLPPLSPSDRKDFKSWRKSSWEGTWKSGFVALQAFVA